jgi:hypothetical protein
MRKVSLFLLTTAFVSLAISGPVRADDWHRHGDFQHDHHFDHWHDGRWFNGFHDGRTGWWWIVDGLWYFYPAPVYPYPDPYTPPTVVIETTPAPQGSQVYYYCANPAGYYPQVPQCAAWQRVISATPASPPQVVAPQAPMPAASQHDIDMQHLGSFTARLQAVNPGDHHARAQLKQLGKEVEAFRKSLYARSYNAMDVLRSSEYLKQRISDEREWLAKHPGTLPPSAMPPVGAPPVAVMPPPTSPPPGTAVTFPPPQ